MYEPEREFISVIMPRKGTLLTGVSYPFYMIARRLEWQFTGRPYLKVAHPRLALTFFLDIICG